MIHLNLQLHRITHVDFLYRNEFDQRFGITMAFLATRSGLTRWMDFQKSNYEYVWFMLMHDCASKVLIKCLISFHTEIHPWVFSGQLMKFGINEPLSSTMLKHKVLFIRCHSMKVCRLYIRLGFKSFNGLILIILQQMIHLSMSIIY